MMKSKSARMCRVGIKLSVADNANKNVEFPQTEIKESLFSQDSKQAFVFLKIDPSKETWGDISFEVTVKPGKTSQISTSYGYGTSSYGNTSSYNSGGYYNGGTYSTTQTTQSTSYLPVGYGTSTETSCVNCSSTVFVGEEYCDKCGKSTTEYDTDAV